MINLNDILYQFHDNPSIFKQVMVQEDRRTGKGMHMYFSAMLESVKNTNLILLT